MEESTRTSHFLRQLITVVMSPFINRGQLVQFADNNRKHQQLLGCADCWAQCMSSNRSRRPQYIKPRRHGQLQIQCDSTQQTTHTHMLDLCNNNNDKHDNSTTHACLPSHPSTAQKPRRPRMPRMTALECLRHVLTRSCATSAPPKKLLRQMGSNKKPMPNRNMQWHHGPNGF